MSVRNRKLHRRRHLGHLAVQVEHLNHFQSRAALLFDFPLLELPPVVRLHLLRPKGGFCVEGVLPFLDGRGGHAQPPASKEVFEVDDLIVVAAAQMKPPPLPFPNAHDGPHHTWEKKYVKRPIGLTLVLVSNTTLFVAHSGKPRLKKVEGTPGNRTGNWGAPQYCATGGSPGEEARKAESLRHPVLGKRRSKDQRTTANEGGSLESRPKALQNRRLGSP